MAKDCLTEGNVPHCECAICLDNFLEGDNFVKTDCYHYFHSPCLARYARSYVKGRRKEEEENVKMMGEDEFVLKLMEDMKTEATLENPDQKVR